MRVHTQSGAALVILLTIFILGSLTFLLSEVNERSHYLVENQEQTILALNQAKESLLGFAATYAQNHEVKLQGYLPCPDRDGDGSLDMETEVNACKGIDKDDNEELITPKTVLGRFPWRTLGLPPLRDGSGECLWYVVSANFKDTLVSGFVSGNSTPDEELKKRILTSDSNGEIEIKNAKNEIVAGKTSSERAIAVIIAPGLALKGQNRGNDDITLTYTECGSKENNVVPINNVINYLDKYNFDGVVINNANGNDSIYYKSYYNDDGIFKGYYFSTLKNGGVTPTFINAPPVYETYTYPQDGSRRLDRANPTFNDTLVAITPEDFKPVYRMMDYQVATQVRACLDRYAQQSLYHFMEITEKSIIDKFIQQHSPILESSILKKIFESKEKTPSEVLKEEILSKVKSNVKSSNIPYPKYPWTSKDLRTSNKGLNQGYFGKILTPPPKENTIVGNNLDKTRTPLQETIQETINNYIDYVKGEAEAANLSEEEREELEQLDVLDFFENRWEELETEFATIPDKWPVDPQEPFSIFDLHDLEYEALENNPKIEVNGREQNVLDMLKDKVLDTLKDKEILEAFKTKYGKNTKEEVETTINDYSEETKTQFINDIKSILTEEQKVLQDYRCFNSSSNISQWGWWSAWQDKVFFAIHSDYSLNNTIDERMLTFETPKEQKINAEMLVFVAGRSLNGQQRSNETQKTDITNYLEGKNSDGDTHFIHAPVTSTFNDVVL